MRANRRRLAGAITEFLTARRELGDYSNHTLRAYAHDLGQLVEFLNPTVRVSRVAAADVQAWIGHLKSSGYAPASCRRKVAVARCFFGHCVRQDLMSSSPFDRLRLRFRTQPDLPKTLTHDELAAILRHVRSAARRKDVTARHRFLALRDKAMLDLLLATGLRVGELTALRIKDVDLVELVVRVRGKGGRERVALLESEACVVSIRAYLEERSGLAVGGDRVFLNARHDPLGTQGVAHILRQVATIVGIERRITPHMFRHTAATLLLSAGVDVRLVQVYLGHKSIVTTQRYTHVSSGLLRRSLAQADPLGQFAETG